MGGFLLGYLVCDKCEGYYELQPGEKPEDFDSCECGGKLSFREDVPIINDNLPKAPINYVCSKCGTKNPQIAHFCSSCGSEIKKRSKKPSNNTQKNPSNKPINLWNKQNSEGRAAIVLIGICCLGLLLILGASGMLSSNKASSFKSKEPFEAYGTDDGTYYSSEFLSFSHNPFKTITHSNKLKNYTDIVSADFENGDGVLVQKPVATTQSAYEAAVESKEGINGKLPDSSMTSNANIESIQIAGVTGYKVDSLNYNNGEFVSHSINIFFVKNGKLYQIIFTSVGRDTINQNKGNMDKILSSIKVD